VCVPVYHLTPGRGKGAAAGGFDTFRACGTVKAAMSGSFSGFGFWFNGYFYPTSHTAS
jgi:hypothetical protein